MEFKRIIISRIDKIGDVVLTLPLAGYLKKKFPESQLIFLGRKYTKPIIDSCTNIDEFLDWDYLEELPFKKRLNVFKRQNADVIIHVFPNSKVASLASKSGIPNRVGTSRRLYHRLYVNKLIPLSRKKSDLHEAQLNIALASKWLNDATEISLEEIPDLYGFDNFQPLREEIKELVLPNKFNLILHPKSKGSAREWGVDKYAELIRELPVDQFNIMVAGTDSEAREMEQLLKVYSNRIIDLTGKLTLSEYISLISISDGLVACSTGPLHIAAAAGKLAIGLYAPMKPIYPKRWAPLGKNATYLVKEGECNKCRKLNYCECIESIPAKDVIKILHGYYHNRFCLHST